MCRINSEWRLKFNTFTKKKLWTWKNVCVNQTRCHNYRHCSYFREDAQPAAPRHQVLDLLEEHKNSDGQNVKGFTSLQTLYTSSPPCLQPLNTKGQFYIVSELELSSLSGSSPPSPTMTSALCGGTEPYRHDLTCETMKMCDHGVSRDTSRQSCVLFSAARRRVTQKTSMFSTAQFLTSTSCMRFSKYSSSSMVSLPLW